MPTSEPGAIGAIGAKLAELTMPFGLIPGGMGLARTVPLTRTEPCRFPVFLAWLVMDTPEELKPRGVQVPAQAPSRRAVSASGGSPFEKVVTADPVVSGSPQSSTIFISIGLGQAAGMLKSVPTDVNRRTSFDAAQPAAEGALDAPAPPLARSISATFTVRSEPSPKRNVTARWNTPVPRPATC